MKRNELVRVKRRVARESRKKYNWAVLFGFDELKGDTNKRTLPLEVYEYVKKSPFIPRYQWTMIDVATRIRFLAWSYSRDWCCGQVFGKVVVWWLRLFGFWKKITLWTDGGTEFDAGQLGGFERSHQTDDYEFYIPYLMEVKSERDFLKLGGWWIKVYNLYRPHMGIQNMTPYQKLLSFGKAIPKEFCCFPLFNLRLSNHQRRDFRTF